MSRPIRTRTVIGTRPPQAPHGYVIYNAPRPIYGDVLWTGDFCSGIFYAAIDFIGAKRENARRLHELNRQQDAVILTFVTEEELFQAGRTRILASNPEAEAEIDEARHRGWIIDSQLDHINHPEAA